jgi:hypothetical protein
MIRIVWAEGQMTRAKDIPSNADVKVDEGVVVFLSEDHKLIFAVIPAAGLISAVEQEIADV